MRTDVMINRLNDALRRLPVWVVYVGLAVPVPYLFWLAATGGLGVEPIEALEHETGRLALQLLIAGLAVTPLRRFGGLNLMRFRRAIGVMAFVYVALHLLVWLLLDVRVPSEIWADIDWAVRRLGRLWRVLHRAVYGAALLGGFTSSCWRRDFRSSRCSILGPSLPSWRFG
jgi:sulfoxide reductase heme-binding subunit YedZ